MKSRVLSRPAVCLLAAWLLVGCSHPGGLPPQAEALAHTWKAMVLEVLSGDTILVAGPGKADKVKLYAAFSPDQNQPFYPQSQAFTARMVLGKTVDLAPVTTGINGVEIAVVYVGGRCLNAALIAAGYAWYFERYVRQPQWRELEVQARALERGLWSQAHPHPPGAVVDLVLHVQQLAARYRDKIIKVPGPADQIRMGMTVDEGFNLCGRPSGLKEFNYQQWSYRRWTCGKLYVYFENGRVFAVEAARDGER